MSGRGDLVGEVLDGKYRVERLLGEGGMGAVYLATHMGTDRPVALKVITPRLMDSEEFVERFRREARAAGRLRHPNVVDVTDFGFARTGEGEVAYLVMEYLDGCTLADVLEEERRLTLDWVADIIEQAASAVGEAHRQGIVHRDLKPENIWLEPNRLGGYRVKVLDFGIAKLAGLEETAAAETPPDTSQQVAAATTNAATTNAATSFAAPNHTTTGELADTVILAQRDAGGPNPRAAADEAAAPNPPEVVDDETLIFDGRATDQQSAGRSTAREPAAYTVGAGELTRVGAIMGTPAYMSPEQCGGQRLDARSDIYSLGVIAYQMLAGEAPFGGDPFAVISQHLYEPPPPLRSKNGKLPKGVERVVMQALSKNPSERPATAEGFAGALRAHSEGVGALLRHAFALYSEYFPKFLRVSLLAHIPVFVVTVAALANDLLRATGTLAPGQSKVVGILLALLSTLFGIFTYSVITGVTVLIVLQLLVAPLRPVQVGAAFRVLKRRWRPFLSTALRIGALQAVGFALFILPMIYFTVRYALYAPVVLVEGLRDRAAMRRATELMRRSRRTVIAIVLIQFLIPMTVGLVSSLMASMAEKGAGRDITVNISTRLPSLLNVLIVPLLATMLALLYLKVRKVGGETFGETLEGVEGEDAPRSRWQQRMRERLTVHTTAR